MNKKYIGIVITVVVAVIVINRFVDMKSDDADISSIIVKQQGVDNKSSIQVKDSLLESSTIIEKSSAENSINNSIQTLVAVKNSNISENAVDEIGGYIDENALAPEDEVFQNKDIENIGYYDPNGEAPGTNKPPSTETMMIIEPDSTVSAPENGT